MAASLAFYIRGDDGQEYGPVEMDELREWVRENRAGLGSKVRYDQPDALWQPWQYYPELVALLAELRAGSGGTAFVVAPVGKRMLAFVLDFILSCILVAPVLGVVITLYMPDWSAEFGQLLLNPSAPIPATVSNHIIIGDLITYFGLVLYMAGFHAAHGKTPAKALLRLRVVDPTGHKPSLLKALVRGLVFAISLNLYCIPFISILLNPQRRGLHDWVSGTMVVKA